MQHERETPSVHVADPSYGPGFDALDGEPAPVDTRVEADVWAPRVPPAAPGGELAFVDGVQQVEAWLTITPADDPVATSGAAFAVGAGAVIAPPGQAAHLVRPRIRRLVAVGGHRLLRLPESGGFGWEARTQGSEGGGIARRVGQVRQELEHTLAEELAVPGRLVVVDGPLSFLRDSPGPVVGAVKSHHRMYLPPAEAAVIVALRVGWRTPLFAIGEDRLSWYQRLPGVGERGWAGILRGEVARAVGVEEARRLADRAAAELPRFAGRPWRDPRAPQNLTPIAALEAHLKRRLGDRRLALRAVRRAALRATLDARPVRVGVSDGALEDAA